MYKLFKDSVLIIERDDMYKLVKYIHDNHAYSFSHALKYEGYTITRNDIDITNEYK